MTGARRLLFHLARLLGRTVDELGAMPARELAEWNALESHAGGVREGKELEEWLSAAFQSK